jgi:GNAT superfamily N-acetyltransferase
MFNNVRLAVLNEELADDEIGEVIEPYRRSGSDFAWVVGPLCRPADLGERLLRHGLEPHSDSWGMVLEAEKFEQFIPDGVSVRRIDVDSVDDYVMSSDRGWGASPAAGYEADLRRALEKHSETLSAYIAYEQGVPAGSGLMRMFPECAVFIGSSVLPEHRGRGVYRALLTQRLLDMGRAGRTLAVMAADSTSSGPICERFGFERVCSFRAYSLAPTSGAASNGSRS